MKFTMTSEEMEFASKVGELRCFENKGKSDIADYDHKRFTMNSLQINKLGVVAEMAVVKYFGLDPLHTPLDVWPSFYLSEHKSIYDGPDVHFNGVNYEVRRVNKRTNPVAIRQKDVDAHAIVIQVYVDYKQIGDSVRPSGEVEILGFADAAHDWENATIPPWAKSNKSRVTAVRPMTELEGVAA